MQLRLAFRSEILTDFHNGRFIATYSLAHIIFQQLAENLWFLLSLGMPPITRESKKRRRGIERWRCGACLFELPEYRRTIYEDSPFQEEFIPNEPNHCQQYQRGIGLVFALKQPHQAFPSERKTASYDRNFDMFRGGTWLDISCGAMARGSRFGQATNVVRSYA